MIVSLITKTKNNHNHWKKKSKWDNTHSYDIIICYSFPLVKVRYRSLGRIEYVVESKMEISFVEWQVITSQNRTHGIVRSRHVVENLKIVST